MSDWNEFMQSLLDPPQLDCESCDPYDMQGRGGNAFAAAIMLAAAMVMFIGIVWAVCNAITG